MIMMDTKSYNFSVEIIKIEGICRVGGGVSFTEMIFGEKTLEKRA